MRTFVTVEAVDDVLQLFCGHFTGDVLPYSRASLSFVRELTYSVYLWSPYRIGHTIIFFALWLLSFFMVALCNRADHYIFILFLLSSSFFFFFIFFPRLISAVGDWMSTILQHMVWS